MNRRALQSLGFALLCGAAILCALSCKGKSDGKVHLRFWHAWGGREGEFLEKLVAEFNASHPGIVVEPSLFNIGDKLMASIAGGNPPDIATVWDFMLTPMGESGCFLPLEDRLRAAGRTPETFLPGVWDYGMYGEHKWGVPASLNAWGIYYNRKDAREAGLDPDKPPATAAELAEWGGKLSKRDGTRLSRIGFAPAAATIWMWNFGGSFFDAKTKRFTLTDANNIRAVEWMKSIYDDIGMEDYRRLAAGFGNRWGPQHPFLAGKISMGEDGQWLTRFIEDYTPDLDYNVILFPPEHAGDPGITRVDGSFWVIPTGTEHPEEAWTFLQWFTAPEQSSRFCAELHNIPPLRASLDSAEFQKVRSNPHFDFFVRAIIDGHGRSLPAIPVAQEFSENMDQGMPAVFSGSVSAADFLSELQQRMNDQMARSATLLGVEAGK
ncbi:extracellular solute-binding protein [soil metagenome]